MSKEKLDYEWEQKKSVLSYTSEDFLMVGGGPANISDRVLKVMSKQVLLPIGPEVLQLIDKIKVKLQYVLQTKNRLTFVSQTAGNGGNEILMTNILDPGDKLVIAVGGTWGDIAIDMADRNNYDTLSLRKPHGEVFTNQELEEAVIKHQAKLLFVTHGESTGGILQNLDGLGSLCHKHNCLLGIDAVVSIGCEPLFTDRWQVDIVNAASQKAIGAPPGMCLMTFSERAEKAMQAKKTRPAYYLDAVKLGTFWGCFGTPRAYHYTVCSNLLAALHEALAQICEEGLLKRWARHTSNAELFWKSLEEIGMECYVKNPKNRFHGVTLVKIPNGIDEMTFLNYLKDKYLIVISPGFGPSRNIAMRVGFMAQNSSKEVVEYVIEGFKDALNHFKSINGLA